MACGAETSDQDCAPFSAAGMSMSVVVIVIMCLSEAEDDIYRHEMFDLRSTYMKFQVSLKISLALKTNRIEDH